MRHLCLLLALACGSSVGGEASADLTVADAGDAGDAGPFYTGSCLLDGGGFYGIEQDAGFTGDPGPAGPTATVLPLDGSWRIVAPVCYAGDLESGAWGCHGWTGSIKARHDPYYAGGWLLDVWPQPPIWQYASPARVTFISDNEIHAVVMDGYWGFPNSVIFLCRTPP